LIEIASLVLIEVSPQPVLKKLNSSFYES